MVCRLKANTSPKQAELIRKVLGVGLKEQIEQFVSALTLLPPQTVSNLIEKFFNRM